MNNPFKRNKKGLQGINLNDPRWRSVFGLSGLSESGINITPENALNFSAVFNAVTIISQDVARLPLPIYRRLGNGGKEMAFDHPAYPVFNRRPNPLMSRRRFWQMMMVNLLLQGNAYARIERDGLGNITAIWPYLAKKVDPVLIKNGEIKLYDNTMSPEELSGGTFLYRVRDYIGREYPVMWRDMLHIPGLGFNGIVGKSVITMARETVGLGLVQEKWASNFYSKGARPSIGLKLEGKYDDLTDETLKNIRTSFKDTYGGVDNVGEPMVLEQGMDIVSFALSQVDAQFLETRKFGITEIARWFNLPPHKLRDLERATFSNIESQESDYARSSIAPWCDLAEQECNLQLFPDRELDQYFVQFVLEGLMRGDSQARGQYYKDMFYSSAMTRNEIRAKENLNPDDGPDGDTFYVPVNLLPVPGQGESPPPVAPQPPKSKILVVRNLTNTRKTLRQSHVRIFKEASGRVMRADRRNMMKIIEKHLEDDDYIKQRIEEYYRGEHLEIARRNLLGPAMTLAEAVQPFAAEQVGADPNFTEALQQSTRIHSDKMSERRAGAYRNRLIELIEQPTTARATDTLIDAVAAEFDIWQESQPGQLAAWETVRIDNMIAASIFGAAGFKERWVCGPNACPLCQEMDGVETRTDEPYITTDDVLSVDGANDLTPSWNVMTAPLHGGCECSNEPA